MMVMRGRKEATMKALAIGLVVLAVAVLLGAGCRTAGHGGSCAKCGMPPECCTCGPAK